MADDIRSRVFSTGTNCLDDTSLRRIDDFLMGKLGFRPFVERVKLNETFEEDSGCTQVITFEMNYMTGRWRKLRSRSRVFGESSMDANGDLKTCRPTLDMVICGR